jgi:DNA-binding NarL/FixJ family response regulator
VIRVLLVDDHAMMRAGFRTILEAAGDIAVVGEAATGRDAVDAASALRPDVICMDVQMPDMDGLEATRLIAGSGADASETPGVIIVTTFDRDDYLFAALEAGASGFLLKNAGADELVAAVRIVAGGDALLAPEVTRRVIGRFATAPVEPALVVWTPAESLTEREREVLRLVAQARSNAEIARALYIGEATVKTHVSNVLQKLGARDRVHAAVLAHQHDLA